MRARVFIASAMTAIAAIGLAGPAIAQTSGAPTTTAVSQALTATAAPYCGIWWGSLPKSGAGFDAGSADGWSVANMRAGRHDCYDRLVIDMRGGSMPYRVQYVQQLIPEEGTPVDLDSGAILEIRTLGAHFNWETRTPYFQTADQHHVADVTGFRTFRQVVYAGGFEGVLTMGLVVRARLPFRVFTLSGPGDLNRLVIDVAHRW